MHTAIHVAGTRHDISRGLVAGGAIYNLADIDPARQHLLLELADDRDVPLRPDDYIVINGRERFSVADVYLYMLTGWQNYNEDGTRLGHHGVQAHYARVGARPAIARTRALDDLDERLLRHHPELRGGKPI